MTDNNTSFHPEEGEKDVEPYFRQLSAEDAQLLDDLRDHYSFMRARSTHVLAHAWERIQQEQRSMGPHFVQDEDVNAFVHSANEMKREVRLKDMKVASKKSGRLGQRANVLVAAVLLTFIVGSMVLVSGYFHAQTSTGSGSKVVTTVTSPSPMNGSTPGAQKGQSPTAEGSSLNWPVGHDTYWANHRYHQITGYWVSWHGNANQWVAGAQATGWHVSQTPHVPSILVLMPLVQGAPVSGHVAVVEALVSNNSPAAVHTSNMNWYVNGGGWNIVSYTNFTVGTGAYFIWHP